MSVPGRGALLLVATPIGNLEDITLRALRVLAEADLIAAEDTRTTRKLLARYSISTPLTSFHRHTAASKQRALVEAVAAGKRVAVVSEAGMPGISDPGAELVRGCLEAGLPVFPVPGPTALVSALAVSGLETRQFTFLGFLPRAARERHDLLRSAADQPRTLVFFEAPHRLISTLEAVEQALGGRRVVVARELTKVFEEVLRGTAGKLAAHFREHPPRGEFTVMVEGAPAQRREGDLGKAVERARALVAEGSSARDAARQAAQEEGVPRSRVYHELIRPGR